MAEPAHRIAFAHNLRGLAAAFVVFSHIFLGFYVAPRLSADLIGFRDSYECPTPAATLWVFQNLPCGPAHIGVALFFLLSGFVIPFSLRLQGPGPFLASRVFRLWPAYTAALCLTIAGLWIARILVADPGQAWPGHKPIIYHLLFMRDFAGAQMLDGIVWTLEVEVKFYLLCALIYHSLRRGETLPLVLFAVAGAVVVCWTGDGTLGGAGRAKVFVHLAQTSFQMIAFMMIGVVFHYHHEKLISTGKALLVGGALLSSFAFQWHANHQAISATDGVRNYCYGLVAFGACYAYRERIGPNAILGWLADISYPLYLLHGFLGYAFLTVFLRFWDVPYLALVLYLALILLLSWLLHRFVEAPGTAVGKRFAAWLGGRPTEKQPSAEPAPALAKAA